MDTLRYVLLANGLLAVVSVAYYVLLRQETFFAANRLILWLGVVASFALPLLELPDLRPQPVRTAMQHTAQVIRSERFRQPTISPAVTKPSSVHAPVNAHIAPSWTWLDVLVWLYGLVLVGLLIRFGVQLLSLHRLIYRSVQEPYDDFILVSSPTVLSPFSFFNWVVLNPALYTDDELDLILRHERLHVQSRHSLDTLGATLLCCLLWFNPAVYLFRYLIHQVLEFSADQAVLAEGVDARTYQYSLLRVSMAEEPSTITNHFNRSQLKTRISMIARTRSSALTAIKYPLVGLIVLVVTAAFSHPVITAPTANNILPASMPVKRAISSPLVATATSVSLLPDTASSIAPEDAAVISDSVRKVSESIPVEFTGSRLLVKQGDYLYWIITPKTTLEDFALLQQELAKYGNTMQLNEVKYDPLYTYIDRIVFSVIRSSGGSTKIKETDDDFMPIPTVSGYVGIGAKAGASGTGQLKNIDEDGFWKKGTGAPFPTELRQIAANDEAAIANFIVEHRIDYLMQEGDQKFSGIGSGRSTYGKPFFQNKSIKASGLIRKDDGHLSVVDELQTIPLYVNNQPTTVAAIQELTVDQVYSVIKVTTHDPAQNKSVVSALLIYTETIK